VILNVDASHSTETGVGGWAVHQRIRRGKVWRLIASGADHCATSGRAEEAAVQLALDCLSKTDAKPPHLIRCDCEPVVRRLNKDGLPEGVGRGGHAAHGEWWWRDRVPGDVELGRFYR
jgi:ribonuclease HI